MPEPEGELAYLGVTCDALPFCDSTLTGDFKVRVADGYATRLGYVLDHAARNGWRVEGRTAPVTAKTFCPGHA